MVPVHAASRASCVPTLTSCAQESCSDAKALVSRVCEQIAGAPASGGGFASHQRVGCVEQLLACFVAGLGPRGKDGPHVASGAETAAGGLMMKLGRLRQTVLRELGVWRCVDRDAYSLGPVRLARAVTVAHGDGSLAAAAFAVRARSRVCRGGGRGGGSCVTA